MSIRIDAERLKTVFPFHVAFSSDMKILQFGNSIPKLCPEIRQGEAWGNHFQIVRPKQIDDIATLRKHSKTIFVVDSVARHLNLKGEILFIEESESYLFIATPVIRSIASLADYGIGMNDFAHHDPIIDSLFLMQTRDKSIQEIEAFSKKLTQKNRELDRLKHCLDNADDGIFMFDARTLHFFYVNQGALNQTGYTMAELATMTPVQIRPGYSEESYRAKIAPLISGAINSYKYDTVNRHKDGTLIPVELSLQYVAWRTGLGGYFVAITRDITERNQVREELDQHRLNLEQLVAVRTAELTTARNVAESASRAKSEFLASMSHEFRTPLNAILGYAQLLSLEASLQENIKSQIYEIWTAGQHLLALINDMIDLTRIEAGKMELALEPVAIIR